MGGGHCPACLPAWPRRTGLLTALGCPARRHVWPSDVRPACEPPHTPLPLLPPLLHWICLPARLPAGSNFRVARSRQCTQVIKKMLTRHHPPHACPAFLQVAKDRADGLSSTMTALRLQVRIPGCKAAASRGAGLQVQQQQLVWGIKCRVWGCGPGRAQLGCWCFRLVLLLLRCFLPVPSVHSRCGWVRMGVDGAGSPALVLVTSSGWLASRSCGGSSPPVVHGWLVQGGGLGRRWGLTDWSGGNHLVGCFRACGS